MDYALLVRLLIFIKHIFIKYLILYDSDKNISFMEIKYIIFKNTVIQDTYYLLYVLLKVQRLVLMFDKFPIETFIRNGTFINF